MAIYPDLRWKVTISTETTAPDQITICHETYETYETYEIATYHAPMETYKITIEKKKNDHGNLHDGNLENHHRGIPLFSDGLVGAKPNHKPTWVSYKSPIY